MFWNREIGLSHLDLLVQPHETGLISLIFRYPEVLESTALNDEPDFMAYYLRELANALHSHYNDQKLLGHPTALL